MKTNYSVNDLSKHLFWDVDISMLSFENSKEQIIYKVVEFGLIKDWNIIKEIYSLETIKAVSLEFRSLDVVTLSFLATIFNINKSEFRCYKLKQSNLNFWNY
jgi:hypothetical protein